MIWDLAWEFWDLGLKIEIWIWDLGIESENFHCQRFLFRVCTWDLIRDLPTTGLSIADVLAERRWCLLVLFTAQVEQRWRNHPPPADSAADPGSQTSQPETVTRFVTFKFTLFGKHILGCCVFLSIKLDCSVRRMQHAESNWTINIASN